MKQTDASLVLNWEDLTRENKIRFEQARLREILQDVPRQQIALCERLIDRAAFMLVSLMDYEREITEQGVITEMCQGEYTIKRENPAARGYNTMVKNYQAVIRQLTDLLPDKREAACAQAGEKLAAFVARGKK